MYLRILAAFLVFSLFLGCGTDEPVENTIEPQSSGGCSQETLLESFTDTEGNTLFIYENGEAYLERNGTCEFALQYFDDDFLSKNYEISGSGAFLKADEGLVPVKNNFEEDFEAEPNFIDLFVSDLDDERLFWTNFTLQGPMAKEVSDYVRLSQCILSGSCDFLDNRIDITSDPIDPGNRVARFEAVSPTVDMVTSKASMTSILGYFAKGSHIWFEGDYFIETGMPYSLVDFESSYFEGSPGPRVIITNGKLAFNNKFGAKLQYETTSGIMVPSGEWFTVKVHLKLSNSENGILELWQNGELVIAATGINLQTANGLQNILEVGISAIDEATVLLMDNIKISDTAF
ncbi:hypothetical protein FK220_001460 [Flavobacteriaceae bacterium TP-CH-4]|uniref:Lipocalin-like domain-containing protein n=1 Tax=Pelagihabitans pacificus TaxID=2696054 RepID=A0A967AS90_9FLAO|nr:heparin lyase I family protein [Pelagihabitans pacificus]NHF57988.1 hypothetical protein [Pelagihabitans pacificus]